MNCVQGPGGEVSAVELGLCRPAFKDTSQLHTTMTKDVRLASAAEQIKLAPASEPFFETEVGIWVDHDVGCQVRPHGPPARPPATSHEHART